jgi:hypothetical protein
MSTVPTCGHTGSVMFRIYFGISGCWRTAREGGAKSREEEWVALVNHPWDKI